MKNFVPYIIVAAVMTVIAAFLIPAFGALILGKNYSDGFNLLNYIIAAIFGVGAGVGLYLDDLRKKKAGKK